MTVVPMFELIMVLALTAFTFAPLANNYSLERSRAQVQSLATSMGMLSEKVQSWCDSNNYNCTGASFSALQTAGSLSPAQVTQYQSQVTITPDTDPNNSPDDFIMASTSTYPSAALNSFPLSTGTQALNTGSYLCYRPYTGGLYKSTSAACT
jgi:hypothetical protein